MIASSVVSTLLAVACTGSDDAASRDPAPEAADEDGVIMSADLSEARQLWTVSIEPTLSIGVFEGAEAEQLVNVSDATVLVDGSVVVADVGAASVRVFDERGAFRTELGGRGSGPGEFRVPADVTSHPDGSVSVFDDALYRVTTLSPDGALAGVHSFGLDGLMKWVDPPLYPASGWVLANGDVVLRLQEKAKPPASGSFREAGGALRVSSDGSEGEVLATFADREQVLVPWDFGTTTMMVPMPPPLGPRVVWADQPGGNGFCTGDSGTGRVQCIGSEGFDRTLILPAPDGEVTPDDPQVRRWRVEEETALLGKISPDEARRFLDRVPLPARLPAFVALHLDTAGNLWVQPPAGRSEGPIRHHVFGVDGTPLGWVDLPRMRVLEIGEGYVLGVQEDEFEVQYVRRFELMRSDPR